MSTGVVQEGGGSHPSGVRPEDGLDTDPLRRSASPPPRAGLLVSVRDAAEARAALDGGCDVLDVKEPSRGSLGMADSAAIAAVVDAARRRGPVPISAALGEAADWRESGPPAPSVLGRLAYMKLGLAGLGGDGAWIETWCAVRQEIERTIASPPRWIAVAYADWRESSAPAPGEVIAAAAATGCAGVLFDTFAKTGRTLLDHLPVDKLSVLAARARRHGLLFALAGSLRAEDAQRLLPVRPDLVAIRTAACRNGHRAAPVDAARVRAFRRALAGGPPSRGR